MSNLKVLALSTIGVVLTLLIFVGFILSLSIPVSAADALPAPPAGSTDLGKSPVAQCGENWGVYLNSWDTNPENPYAAIYEYGRYEVLTDEPRYFSPVLSIVIDEAGEKKAYLLNKGVLKTYDSIDALGNDYPSPCELPGIKLEILS